LSLLSVALSVLSSLSHGSVLIVDELERSLHPLLALYIINQFESHTSNPKHAQLIFTTHDTNLLGTSLGEPPLARDQVWLTEKDQTGTSVIYPLSDYKPRKAENVERGYLQGRYGAIPFLGIENLIAP
jgi:AAA15 family ATPase/GTPase